MSKPIKTKQCWDCKKIKASSDFHKDRRSKDGLFGRCKACHKKYKQSDKGKAVDRKYIRGKKGSATTKQYRQTSKYKVAHNRRIRKYAQENQEKIKARKAVNHAVKSGRMPRVDTFRCECDKQAEHYHHYKGYARKHWFDVIPVCLGCHKKLHLVTVKLEINSDSPDA